MRARHVTRTECLAGGFVLASQPRHPDQLRRAHRRDRRPVREPRPGAQRAVEGPIGAGVPLAHRADDLGLEALRDLEQLDQLIRPGRTRPGPAVLGVEVFDCEADLLDRVITEHVFDSTQGVRHLPECDAALDRVPPVVSRLPFRRRRSIAPTVATSTSPSKAVSRLILDDGLHRLGHGRRRGEQRVNQGWEPHELTCRMKSSRSRRLHATERTRACATSCPYGVVSKGYDVSRPSVRRP